MSPSEIHAAIKRSLAARLAIKSGSQITPFISHLEEFLIHGIQYVFIPEQGGLQRGLPTAHAAPPLKQYFTQSDEPPPVWPHPEGKMRGMSFSPLYKSVPQAVLNDPLLYELLVLVDAIRAGRSREQAQAIKELKVRLEHYA